MKDKKIIEGLHGSTFVELLEEETIVVVIVEFEGTTFLLCPPEWTLLKSLEKPKKGRLIFSLSLL